MTIRKEHIEDLVNLFLNFLKLIQDPLPLNYAHLKALLVPIIDEQEFDLMVTSIRSIKERQIFKNIDFINSVALSVKMLSLAKRSNGNLTVEQRIVFVIILAKIVYENEQLQNKPLIQALYNIAQMFGLQKEFADTILNLHSADPEAYPAGCDSLLITNTPPDYLAIVNGQNVLYKSSIPVKLLVIKVAGSDVLLFRILEINGTGDILYLKENDVSPYNNSIQHLLASNGITKDELWKKLVKSGESGEKIEIPGTDLTPYVLLDSENNLLKIEGQSINSQPQKFFEPILTWIQKQKIRRPRDFQIHIRLSFFNTYTSKILLEILFQMKSFELIGCKVDFYWYYENDDFEIKEAGENYSIIIEKAFQYIIYDPKILMYE